MGSPARLEFRALQETGEFSRLVSGLIPAQPTEAVDSSGEVSSLRAKGSLYLFSFTLNSSRRSLILAHFANKENKFLQCEMTCSSLLIDKAVEQNQNICFLIPN